VLENCTKGELRGLRIALGIDDEKGQRVALLDTVLVGAHILSISPGRKDVRVVIPKMALIPGRYRLTLYSTVEGVIADWIKDAAIFDVESGDYYGTGHLPQHGEGMLILDHRFVAGGCRAESETGDAAPAT
jgi:lipopolysaccharide transport system ATP-binding protein